MTPLSFRTRAVLGLLGGTLVWLSFPNAFEKTLTPLTAPLAWVALVPFFLALRDASPLEAAGCGWIFGLAQFGGLLYWVAEIQEAQYLSLPGWAALVLYLSFYPALFGLLAAWLRPRAGLFAGLWVPVLWVGLEFIRGHWPFGGFPWGQLGYACAPYPGLLYTASILGIQGLTFLVVWFNSLLAQGLERAWSDPPLPGRGGWVRGLLPPVAVLVLVWGLGRLQDGRARLTPKGSVAIVQPAVDQSVKWDRAYAAETYRRLEKWTAAAGKSKPDLVLWPETAAPSFLLWTPADLARVSAIVRAVHVPLLAGCLDLARPASGPEVDFNAAVAFGPDGKPEGVYHKRHLVPFGEYVPFQKYLRFLGPVVGDLGAFGPGGAYVRMRADSFTYSPVICYEAIFPGDIRRAVEGVDALVNISNDAWYGRTACAYQHAMMAVVRSAEERKPLLRCANTGISLATDPLGRLVGHTALGEQTMLLAPVYTAPGQSPYARWGWTFGRVCLLLGAVRLLLAAGVAWADRRRWWMPHGR